MADMVAKKNVNTFERYQLKKQEKRETLISEFLTYLKTSRVQTRFVTDLADLVSNHISESEGRPCNKATMLRNPRYKSMLLNFMTNSMAKGTKHLSVNDIKDSKAQALIVTAKVESGNLKRDNERLRNYVSQLESLISETHEINKVSRNIEGNSSSSDSETLHIKYVRVCQALHEVILHMKPALSVDVKGKRILDMSKLRNNVIVDSDIAFGYFDWLQANDGITKLI